MILMWWDVEMPMRNVVTTELYAGMDTSDFVCQSSL